MVYFNHSSEMTLKLNMNNTSFTISSTLLSINKIPALNLKKNYPCKPNVYKGNFKFCKY